MKRKRLDEILLEKGLVKDKNEAFIIVTEGRVFVEGQKAVSPAQPCDPASQIKVRNGREFVGRGAVKLEAAMEHFKIDATGKIGADVGAATGGFTQVLLKYGSPKVYAIDTARGKLASKVRDDSRVVVMEKTDVRDLKNLPDPIGIVSIDISLVSLRDILPTVARIAPKAEVVALFKPQYEARDPSMLHHGIIKSAEVREQLFEGFKSWLKEKNWKILGTMESPISGGEGNVEYLVYLVQNAKRKA